MKYLIYAVLLIVLFVIHPAIGFIRLIGIIIYANQKSPKAKSRRPGSINLPVFETRAEAPYDVLFIAKDSKPFIIHFKQHYNGIATLTRDIAVNGISKYQSNVLDFLNGSNHRGIRIEREPNNPYDKNALKVIGIWEDKETLFGYVPKEYAGKVVRLYPQVEIRGILNRIYLPSAGYNLGMKITLAVNRKDFTKKIEE